MKVDEIRMVGCNDVRYNAFKIPKLKSTILPFGGVNIMFMKDFLQFPPIINTPLFSTNFQPTFTLTNSTQKVKSNVKVYGKITFVQITSY